MQAVAEYKSDKFVSSSNKKAREKASRKRHQKEQLSSDSGKKGRIALGADNQLFRGKKKSLELVARAFAPKPLKSERFRP